MANTKRDAGREACWRQTLARHKRSGLTVREFCRREMLHESAFYAWRRIIKERGPRQTGRKPPAFVPLLLGNVTPPAGVTLELRGGRSLRLSESYPVDRLASLVLALEAAENRP